MSDQDIIDTIAGHFPEYISGTCLCGFEIANVNVWAAHVVAALRDAGVSLVKLPDDMAVMPREAAVPAAGLRIGTRIGCYGLCKVCGKAIRLRRYGWVHVVPSGGHLATLNSGVCDD